MRSSSRLALLLLATAPGPAWAQSPVEGFALERYVAAAPASPWLSANDLALPERLGAETALTLGYARRPLRVDVPHSRALDVVSQQAFMEVALAVGYHGFRFSIFIPSPLVVMGNSGTAAGYSYVAPDVTPAHSPDTVTDPRIALESLLTRTRDGRFRLGADAAVIVPSSYRRNYLTDGTFRGMVRLLAAGDAENLSYAAHVGVHLRPVDGAPAPGSPRGSELLLGAAAGLRVVDRPSGTLFLGPELVAASAFRSLLADAGTALEALFGASVTRSLEGGRVLHVKLGAGAGLIPALGTPEWRVVTSIGVSSVSPGPAQGP